MKTVFAVLLLLSPFGYAETIAVGGGDSTFMDGSLDTSPLVLRPPAPNREPVRPKEDRPPQVALPRGPAEHGVASHYWQPQRVGCKPYGQFNPQAMTAAHKTLPCGTKVLVTNKRTGKKVVVTINDRGPYVRGRIIDLSTASFKLLTGGSTSQGLLNVTVEKL